jgi:aspartyl-tRNA(Asn)/glutamyl-tRNA(Gln) amidotransferase subunit C
MSLTLQDVQKVARLAQLDLTMDEQTQTLGHLSAIFGLIDQMSAVDTQGVEPLMHPIAMIAPLAQRLRPDEVTEDTHQRTANMRNAPDAQDGLFLVPKVI